MVGLVQTQMFLLGASFAVAELLNPIVGAMGETAQPVTWEHKVVYYDARYDTWAAPHADVLVKYLENHGFQILNAMAIGEWMKEKIDSGAHKTVAVFPMGIAPESVLEREFDETNGWTIRQYVNAGGRVVWLGEVSFWYSQSDNRPEVRHREISGPGEFAYDYYTRVNGAGRIQITPEGDAWGLAIPSSSSFAVPIKDVTLALTQFQSKENDAYLAMDWFVNYNAKFPWSGFIQTLRGTNLSEPAVQQQVYKLALYVGEPVTAPPPLPAYVPPSEMPLVVLLDAPRDRRAFARGEVIPVEAKAGKLFASLRGRPGAVAAESIRFSLKEHGNVLWNEEYPWTDTEKVMARIPTADLRPGRYQLAVIASAADRTVESRDLEIDLCAKPRDPCFWLGIRWVRRSGNPYRFEMALADMAAHAVFPCIGTDADPALFDAVLRQGMRCALRDMVSKPRRDALTVEKAPEVYIHRPGGQLLFGEPGKAALGLIHPKLREAIAADFIEGLEKIAPYPAIWPYMDTMDDQANRYRWDYSDYAKKRFKELTGLDPPAPPEVAADTGYVWYPFNIGQIDRPKGIVPDKDPWLQWVRFTTREIGGEFNKAVTSAFTRVFPEGRVGPVPQPPTHPVWVVGQYPPDQFGPNGFNLLYYYCYLSYWQPLIANLYWDNIMRMNNRNMPLWTMPDIFYTYLNEPSYVRNTFFLHLAGGVKGLNYFAYEFKEPEEWDELGKLARKVIKPLGPLLSKLRPASAKIGFFLPYTQYAHVWRYPISAVYPFANLMSAHVDADTVSSEEIISGAIGDKEALLLWNVEWMSESEVKALENYINSGGTVLVDATTRIPIIGALKLDVDLAMGKKRTHLNVNYPWLPAPGVEDYFHPDRISVVKDALEAFVKPWADSPSSDLVIRRFEGDGVTYLWLVNIHTQDEYLFLRERRVTMTDGFPTEPRAKRRADVKEFLTERGVYTNRFSTTVSVPDGNYQVYDLVNQKWLETETMGNRTEFTVDMERLGGTLIALYPSRVTKVNIVAPESLPRGELATVEVELMGGERHVVGLYPVEVEIHTPEGLSLEGSGTYVVEKGQLTLQLSPAHNHIPGNWKVKVTEWTGGHQVRAIIRVR